ncbi:MAG TPA: DNA polymerase subunit beta [Spirochaetia bacterium]|nr:DNA polymerase subunit beta [Spirochaetia bacterium]
MQKKQEIKTIKKILIERGCKKIILFGSFLEKGKQHQDIDIAVSGMKPEDFFYSISFLPLLLNKKVDLVDLDDLSPFFLENLQKKGKIIYEI